ncbi:MAG: hypothetical protein Tsb002_26590 [Wenzhouxiangellaceae bacterium]
MGWLINGVRLALAAGVLGFTLVPASVHAQSADEYRQMIYGLADLIIEIGGVNGRVDHLTSVELAISRLEQLPDEVLLQTIGRSVPITDIQAQLANLQTELVQAEDLLSQQQRPADTRSDGIEIPDVTVDPSFCEYATGTIAVIELAAWKVLKEIFAATEFTCLQTIAGTNLAAACASIAVLTVTAELSYTNAEFCLNEQRAAKGETILDLDRNIGAYLNTFIDDTTTSSRASQDSADTLQADVETALTTIGAIRSDLDSGLATIDSDLSDALSSLSDLDSSLTDLTAVADDIQFRVQANQVDIEDVQTRTADLEDSSDEIRTDTQSIISSVNSISQDAGAVSIVLQSGYQQLNRDAIAAALSSVDVGVAEYALPESAGGQLEEAREVLIQSILALDNLNLGDTAAANALLVQGDLAYNQQDYIGAYRLFAQAYQALLGPATVRQEGP